MAARFAQTGRNIVAIGRNYADHIAELKNVTPKEPFFFLKPTSSYIPTGHPIEIPKGISVHYEVELGVILSRKSRDLTPANALSHIAGYALAIDFTARNLQDQVKKKGLPWSAAKGFDTFCPVSQFIPKESVEDVYALELWLAVNGVQKQRGGTNLMLWRIPELLRHVTSVMTLNEGDLLLTGTPAGVGQIKAGDRITAGLSNGAFDLATLEHEAKDRVGGYTFKPE